MKTRWIAVPLAGLGLSLAHAGCAQLVGIEDTNVTVGTGGGADEPNGGGSSGSGSVSQGGSGGAGGNDQTGGSAGSEATGGTATGTGGDAGSAGAGNTPLCQDGAGRCVEAGRETCTSGAWQAAPCPLGQPTCEAGECIVRGPVLVQVGSFFIDATEVTTSQYAQFLAAKGSDTSGQASVCAFNTDFWDEEGNGDISLQLPARPIADVDWCDAAAYCAWADKHLCGRIGGGAIANADRYDQTLSQWYLACGGPNGGIRVNNDAVCNSNNGNGDIADVATFPGCQGYYPGLFDLQGNVAEWVDSCDGTSGSADLCSVLGGNIIDSQSYCNGAYDPYPRGDKAYTFGFRCCSG